MTVAGQLGSHNGGRNLGGLDAIGQLGGHISNPQIPEPRITEVSKTKPKKAKKMEKKWYAEKNQKAFP